MIGTTMHPETASLRLELEACLEFETLLADLSAKFINLPAERIDQEICDVLPKVCEALGLDGIALWESEDRSWESLVLWHIYRTVEGPPVPSRLSAAEHFPWSLGEVKAGRTIVLSSMAQLQGDATTDLPAYRHFEIKSVVDIPLVADRGAPFGVISFLRIREERIWPDRLVKQFRLLAQIFAHALLRKRADFVLRQSEERVVLAMEAADTGLWTLKAGDTRFWCTPNVLSMAGLPPGDGIEVARFLGLVHPEDRSLVHDTINRALESGQMQSVEYRVVHSSGQTRWLASRGRRRVDRDGHTHSIAGTTMDITKRKLVALELEKEKALTEAVFDSVPGLIYLWSPEGKLVRWNRQHEEITGYTAEELKGLRVETYFQGENLVRMRREWERVFTEGRGGGEFDCTMKDGRTVPFVLTGVRVEVDGKPHLVGMGLDISDRRAAEAHLTDMAQQLQRVTRAAALGELSGAIAHELRQPLAGILSTAQAGELMIKGDSCKCSEIAVLLGEIVADTKRADSVIRGLQDLYRKQDASFETLEVGALLRDALREAEKDELLTGAAVHTHVDSLGNVAVRGSRIQLLQVIANLLRNAAHATAGVADIARRIEIGAETNDGTVRIWVKDSGPGIDPTKIDSIFQPLVTWRSGGMGLGLAISRKIVEAHGGTAWAQNIPGGGACVGFSLPMVPQAEGLKRA
ncbi:PAS domain S-box protein [bacterium]|nr:PAS domain S-box protein [bacterium]